MITLDFDVEDLGGITFRIHPPAVAEGKAAWLCRIEWSGLERGDFRMGGVSSLQSLELAIFFIRSQLAGAFPDRRITQGGVLFI